MADEHQRRKRVLSSITSLLGLWLVVAPWALGAPAPVVAWNGVVVGVIIVLCGLIRFNTPRTAALSWTNVVLGAWAVMSPWALGHFSGDARTWNYVIVGVAVAAIETFSLTSSALNGPWSSTTKRERSST